MAKLTSDEVVDIVGNLDDLRIAEIIGTGATAAEVVEAKRWAAGYQRTIADHEDLRPSVVAKVTDLLRADEAEWDEG